MRSWPSLRGGPAILRLRGLVEVEIRLHDHLFEVAAEVEPELLRDALHGAVVEEYFCGDAPQILGAGDLEEVVQDQGADAPALEAVADEDGELGLVGDGAAAAPPMRRSSRSSSATASSAGASAPCS